MIPEPIKYTSIRIKQLEHELTLTKDEETVLILTKAIYELELVLDLLKRNKLLDTV